jgi:hypothetical protein
MICFRGSRAKVSYCTIVPQYTQHTDLILHVCMHSNICMYVPVIAQWLSPLREFLCSCSFSPQWVSATTPLIDRRMNDQPAASSQQPFGRESQSQLLFC